MSDLIDKAEALLPCPFCGHRAETQEYGTRTEVWAVWCVECKAQMESISTEAEAIAAWNRRALPARGVGVPTEAQFMDAVWAALKADATDLGKQQRILAAFRAALAPSAVDDSQTPNPAINAPDPIHRPTMTDMMVDPDTLDAFMEANPLPDEPSPTDAAHVNETPKSKHDAGNVLTDAAQAPAEDAHVKGETAGQMLERLGMDGAKWAAEFRTTALRLGYSDMDEGWLIGWFCNAIMAGYDRSAAQAREAAFLGVCECGMTGPCMWDQCKHPLFREARDD